MIVRFDNGSNPNLDYTFSSSFFPFDDNINKGSLDSGYPPSETPIPKHFMTIWGE